MPEVDSFYLPDVAATSYRTDHVKSTIVAESIDEDAKVLRYFHNTGYHELSGEDYDKLFATYSGDGHLPTYVELLRFDAGPVPSGDDLRAVARALLGGYLARRPAENPFARFSAAARGRPARRCWRARPRTTTPTPSTTRGWSAPRWSCWPATCAGCSASEGEKAAAQLDDVVGGSKMLLFRLARQRAFDVAGVVGPMAEAYDAAVDRARRSGWLTAVRQVLEFERLTPEPGPDADAVRHEFVAQLHGRRARASSRSAASRRSGTCWSTARSSRPGGRCSSGTSVPRRRPGDHEVRVVVHPLTELLETLPTKPRQRWRTMLVEEARLRWVRTQLLGRAPGLLARTAGGRALPAGHPGHRPRPAPGCGRGSRARPAWSRSTASGSSSPTPSSGGRTPTARRASTTSSSTARSSAGSGSAPSRTGRDGLARPLGQRRAGLLPRRGVDAGRPGRARRGGRRWG